MACSKRRNILVKLSNPILLLCHLKVLSTNLSIWQTVMVDAEQGMTKEGYVALVKSESKEVEMVTADGDSHLVLKEWADLRKYVHVIKVRGKESGKKRKHFQCSLCGKLMDKATMNRMIAHVEAKHFRELFTHTCDVCQKTFKTKAILMTHMKQIHKNNTV